MEKLYIDWDKLNESTYSMADLVSELDVSRKKMLEITSSIHENWDGVDSKNFVNNFSNYLNKMEKDIDYLNEWMDFFKKVSITFGNVVEENYRRVKDNDLILANNSGEKLYE